MRAGHAVWRPDWAARSIWRPSISWARETWRAIAKAGLPSCPIEQVLLWDPDVIVTIDQDFAASVRSDPLWATIKAVRDGRVHLSPKMPFGWVDFPPSVNRLVGLWWLGKILYPDLFPEDLRPITRDFYRRFYHVTPTDAQIESVLAGPG